MIPIAGDGKRSSHGGMHQRGFPEERNGYVTLHPNGD